MGENRFWRLLPSGPLINSLSRKENNYARTSHCPKISVCSKDGGRHALVVRVRPVKEPAVLRRFAQRHRFHAETGGHCRSQNRCVVRVQAFEERAILRREPQPAGLNGNQGRFFPPGSFSFLRKKYWVSATLSIERSRPSPGARFRAILSWRAMRLTAVAA